MGDFDGDGAPDVAVNAGGRNFTSEYVSRQGEFLLLRNDGRGRLASTAAPVPLKSTGRIVAGDVDGDGHLDALMGTRYGLQFLWGRGDGTLEKRAAGPGSNSVITGMGLWPTASGPSPIWWVGNADGDGIPGGLADLAFSRPTAAGTWEYLKLELTGGGSGPLVFLTDMDLAPVVADFNEDGLPDIAMNASNGRRWDANVLLGTAWGRVQLAGVFPRTRTFTRVYAADLLRLVRELPIHALSHVTGGGLAANLARVLPTGLTAVVDRSSWTPPAVFSVIGGLGNVPQPDIERTLNQGVGFAVVLPESAVDDAVALLAACDLPSWVMGAVHAADGVDGAAAEVVTGVKGAQSGGAQLIGSHRQ